MAQDPHTRRLLIEKENLLALSNRSDLINVEPIGCLPGMLPDKYMITFTCKGIIGIDDKKEPVVSSFHQVSLYIWRELSQEPDLRWLTPIWHPNIKHKEPRDVCTNKLKNYFPAKGLDDVVLMLGRMAQYKIYNAIWQPPWPYDKEVADWVRNYAQPRGIVGPNKPFDNQSLLRVYDIRGGGDAVPDPLPSEPVENNKTASAEEGITLSSHRRSLSGAPSEAAEPNSGIILSRGRKL